MPIYRSMDEIEAHQLTQENAAGLAHWCGGVVVTEIDPETNQEFVGINVPNVEGNVRASEGDYIYKPTNSNTYNVMSENELNLRYVG